jgi:hypothetical protein
LSRHSSGSDGGRHGDTERSKDNLSGWGRAHLLKKRLRLIHRKVNDLSAIAFGDGRDAENAGETAILWEVVAKNKIIESEGISLAHSTWLLAPAFSACRKIININDFRDYGLRTTDYEQYNPPG